MRNSNLKPPWKPGQTGNPGGSSKLQQERAAIRKITRDKLKDLVDLALDSNLAELQRIVKDPTSPALKVGVATSLAAAIKKGDWGTLQSIVDSLLGKVPDKLKVESSSIVRLAECDKAALKEAMEEFDNDF